MDLKTLVLIISAVTVILGYFGYSALKEKLDAMDEDRLADFKDLSKRFDALDRKVGATGYELGQMIRDEHGSAPNG